LPMRLNIITGASNTGIGSAPSSVTKDCDTSNSMSQYWFAHVTT
jgi:hypothetical protein